MNAPDPITVVLIDDNEDDLDLIRRVLKKVELPLDVRVYDKSTEAERFLENWNASDSEIPKRLIIFCDIRMPLLNGFELVARLRTMKRLQSAEVYFLTSSNEPLDRAQAASLKVTGYCLKFPTAAEFTRIIENRAPVAICQD